MRYEIVTGDNLAVSFTPTVVIGFFQADKKSIFLLHYRLLKNLFSDVEIIGCSSESNIFNLIPYVDVDGEQPCVFIMLDMNRDAFLVEMFNKYETFNIKNDKKYSAMMFANENSDSVENAIVHFQEQIGNNYLYGAIAGRDVNRDDKGLLFYNGKFIDNGYILFLIDNNYYHFRGMSIHNFEPVGMELNITKADNKTLFEIEEEPALDVLESMMGRLTDESLESYDYPFFIYSEHKKDSSDNIIPLSTLHKIDRSKKTLTFFKNIKVGDKLRIAIPLDRVGQEYMFKNLMKNIEKGSLGFLFTCIAFKGHWAEMEPLYLMHLAQITGLEFIGLHSLGEIGSLSLDTPSILQNQTLTLVTLNETR